MSCNVLTDMPTELNYLYQFLQAPEISPPYFAFYHQKLRLYLYIYIQECFTRIILHKTVNYFVSLTLS